MPKGNTILVNAGVLCQCFWGPSRVGFRNLDSEPRIRASAFYRLKRSSRRDHAIGEAIVFPSYRFSMRGRPASVRPLAGGTIALVAASALAASVVLSAQPAHGESLGVGRANTELGGLINSGPDLSIGGERLNVRLLQRFYANHNYGPVWTDRPEQANLLVNAVLHAGDHGLAPELFHANLLRRVAELPPLDRELVLSDAFLSFADALARGVMPVERRINDEALTPEPVDVAATLDKAIDSRNPAAVIEELAPTTPTYRALQLALQSFRSGNLKAQSNRLRAIEVNLERERWLPRRLPAQRVWVNAADARLVLYRANKPIFATKVIIGQDEVRNQSPEFQATITAITFNPPWNVPEDIATMEIMPKVRSDPTYLMRHNMVIEPNGAMQQLPGPNAGLGLMKFEMDNRFGVYLHDTSSKSLFTRANRRISHGCIRVQDPRELAALLMEQPVSAIDGSIAMGGTAEAGLPEPVPVFVVYETAFLDIDGTLQFRPDVYSRDAEIWQHLNRPSYLGPRVASRWPAGRLPVIQHYMQSSASP